MATPPNAKAIPQPIDPADVVDAEITLTRGPATPAVPFPLLDEGELVTEFTMTPTAEAVAAGLVVKSGPEYPAPVLSGDRITFWLAIAPEMQGSPLFAGAGLTVPIEVTVTTNHVPPRVKQRTFTATVANQ